MIWRHPHKIIDHKNASFKIVSQNDFYQPKNTHIFKLAYVDGNFKSFKRMLAAATKILS